MNKLTKAGYKNLSRRLEELVEKRQELVGKMELARQEGDLSENAAYHQFREMVAMTTTQIAETENRLNGAQIVENNGNGHVDVGSQVTVNVKGREKVLTIVGGGESDPLRGKISYQSPIGAGLMGKKKGESALIEIPSGTIEYKVVDIQ